MSQDDVVGDNVGLGARAPFFAVEVAKHGAAARCMDPTVVSLHCHRVRLIEGNPVLHPVPKCLETHLCICRVVVAASQKTMAWQFWLLDQWMDGDLIKVWFYTTHIICLLSNPMYLSSRAWGRSQW